jgi:hypothetical protein
MANPTQINQGGAQNQQRHRPGPTGSNAEADDIPQGDEAQRRRNQISEMEKAEAEMPRAHPNQDPAKKKTGEF